MGICTVKHLLYHCPRGQLHAASDVSRLTNYQECGNRMKKPSVSSLLLRRGRARAYASGAHLALVLGSETTATVQIPTVALPHSFYSGTCIWIAVGIRCIFNLTLEQAVPVWPTRKHDL